MIETHDYWITVHGGDPKTGILSSPDGLPSFDVASPPEFGGPAGVWSPEHLFVASVSACLMTTFRAIADGARLEIIDYVDNASGKLVRGEDRLYKIESLTLRPKLVISNPNKVDRARQLLERAKEVCLIGRSISSEVILDPVIEVEW